MDHGDSKPERSYSYPKYQEHTTYVHIHVYMFIHLYVYIYVYMHIYIHMHISADSADCEDHRVQFFKASRKEASKKQETGCEPCWA